jgi:hypothetical protein
VVERAPVVPVVVLVLLVVGLGGRVVLVCGAVELGDAPDAPVVVGALQVALAEVRVVRVDQRTATHPEPTPQGTAADMPRPGRAPGDRAGNQGSTEVSGTPVGPVELARVGPAVAGRAPHTATRTAPSPVGTAGEPTHTPDLTTGPAQEGTGRPERSQRR